MSWPEQLKVAAMLVHAFSHLLPHSDNAQTAYSSAATSAYIPDIPFDSAGDPSAATSLVAAHRQIRRQRAAPYPAHSIQPHLDIGHSLQHAVPQDMQMYPMHDTQSFPSSAHNLHSPQPINFYNPVQNFSDSTVYASNPSPWPMPTMNPAGRVVRFNPVLTSTNTFDGSGSYGSVEMFELTPKPSSQSSSVSLPSPANTIGSYSNSYNSNSGSPITSPPQSAMSDSPSTRLAHSADAPLALSNSSVGPGTGPAAPALSTVPQMGPLGFPAPPMMPPIPPTLPPSRYSQPNSGPRSTGNSNTSANGKSGSELHHASTDSGSMAPPQHTFPTPSELLNKLAAQDASEQREQRRQRRRKNKQEDAARTLGYLPTDPDAISTHDKKRFYLDCIEQYVIYLHEQLRLEKIEPVPVERVSSGRGLASRSIRTMIVHLQRTVSRLHDQRKKAEELYNETRARLGVTTDFLQNSNDDDVDPLDTPGPNLGRRHSISYIPTAQQYTFP